MRFIGIGLAAALSLAVMAPAAVMSAPKKPAAPAAGGLDPKAMAAGMEAVPPLLTQAGLSCTLDQARLIGADKKSGQSYYEFSCSAGVGGVLVANKDAAPSFYSCLETNKPQPDGKPSSLFCKLPGNADPKAQHAAPRGADVDDAPLDAIDHGLFDEVIWPALAARVPGLAALRTTSAWAGYYEMNVVDHNALVGPVADVGNLHVACGFSGHGMQHAPAIGRGVASRLATGTWQSVDLTPLAPSRSHPLLERNIIG